ncbi:MAG: ribosome biogenesis GTPase Der [Candidatus Aminicenantales bacterium]
MRQVVIIGFPNAGKSTLFNRLARQKKSLVHSRTGMTRDRVAATCVFGGKRFELVDTGGFADSQTEPLSAQVKKAAWEAAKAADGLILLLDGRQGLLPAEQDLYRTLKKLGKPLCVAVNKIDSAAQEATVGDYFRLGEDRLFFISAEHKIGISELEEAVAEALPEEAENEAAADEPRPLRIAIVGRVNVGKSSLANRLYGEERFIVSELPGTTRDSTDVLIRTGGKAYVLVDTAGIRKTGKVSDERESAGVIKAKKNIPLADVICLVLDAKEFPTRQDTAVAKLASDSGKPLLIALNKWDLVDEEDVSFEEARELVFRRLEFIDYAPLVTVSALTGKRTMKIFELAEQVFQSGRKRIGTPRLNKFLVRIGSARDPLSSAGNRFKIKYMTQKGVLPPTFALFTNAKASFAPAYEKFFIQKMRETFDLWGTPIKLILKSRLNEPKRN